MSPRIKIECLPEPALLFADGVTGVEPRRALAKAGAADMQPGRSIRIGLVGPAEEVRLARQWLPRLHRVDIARERSARSSQRRCGKTGDRTCRSRRSTDPSNK